MPIIKESDQELGLGNLDEILPETWKNISWVIQSAIEALKEQTIKMRRMIEEVKIYALEANLHILRDVATG